MKIAYSRLYLFVLGGYFVSLSSQLVVYCPELRGCPSFCLVCILEYLQEDVLLYMHVHVHENFAEANGIKL